MSESKVKDFYAQWGEEESRLLESPDGIIERLRTQSILKRYLPKAPATIYDVGGGAGIYAFPLAEQGYSVHLIDYTPLHIEQAKQRAEKTGVALESFYVGDARALDIKDAVADAVLFFGPLYHLEQKSDRDKALREAYRILKPGGVFCAAAVSRFSPVFWCGSKNELAKPEVLRAVTKGLKDGEYSLPMEGRGVFPVYCHLSKDFYEEIEAAGFQELVMMGVEGPSWLFPALEETVGDEKALEVLLSFLEKTEKEPSLLGVSSHILVVGKKR